MLIKQQQNKDLITDELRSSKLLKLTDEEKILDFTNFREFMVHFGVVTPLHATTEGKESQLIMDAWKSLSHLRS
jgi:hypothetical protein